MKNCFDRVSARKAYRMTGISADSVRQRVAQKLGDAPEEQERTKRRMKKKIFFSVLIAAVMFCTAAAAQNFYLSQLLPGNLGIVEPHIQTDPLCRQLGEFEVTVLESISDESNSYMTILIKGLTSKAKQLIQDGNGYEILEAYVEGSLDKPRAGMVPYEIDVLCTDDTFGFIGELPYPNPDHKPVILQLDPFFLEQFYPGTTVRETLSVPTANQAGNGFTITPHQQVTAYKHLFSNAPGVIAVNSLKELEAQITVDKIVLSQFGVWIEYTDNTSQCTPDGCFFLQMADGTIFTYNQIFESGGGGGECPSYTLRGRFRELRDLKEFKAFIIGSTAYPLDGGTPYPVTIDQKLKPFFLPVLKQIDPDRPRFYYPVEELCRKLGAGFTWDEAKQTATVTYHGQTLPLSMGESTLAIPGRNTTVTVRTISSDGTLYSSGLGSPLCLSLIGTGANFERTCILVP